MSSQDKVDEADIAPRNESEPSTDNRTKNAINSAKSRLIRALREHNLNKGNSKLQHTIDILEGVNKELYEIVSRKRDSFGVLEAEISRESITIEEQKATINSYWKQSELPWGQAISSFSEREISETEALQTLEQIKALEQRIYDLEGAIGQYQSSFDQQNAPDDSDDYELEMPKPQA